MPKILPSIRDGELRIPIATLVTSYGIYLLIASCVGIGIIGGISMDILPFITNDALIAGAVTAFVMVAIVGLFIYLVDYKKNKVEALRNATSEGCEVPERKLKFDPSYFVAVFFLAVIGAAFVTVVNCLIGYYLGHVDSWIIAGMIGFFIGPFFAIIFDYFFFHDIATGMTTVSDKLVESLQDYTEAQKKISAAAKDANAELLEALKDVDPDTLKAVLVLAKK